MKRLLILLFLGCGLVLPASVTLEQAVRDGLELSAGVCNGEIEVEIAARRLRLARTRLLPELNAGASWRFQSERMQLSLDPVIQDGRVIFPGLERAVGTLHSWDVHLGLTQPLVTGGILSRRVDQAVALSRTEHQRLAGEKAIRAGEIRAAYYTYRMLCRKRESAQRLLESLELHAGRVDALAAEEQVRRSDVLETLSRIADTRISLEELNQAVSEAAVEFHKLTGHEPGSIENPPPPRLFSQEEARAYFHAHQPRLAEFDARRRWLELEEKVTAGRYRPQGAGYAELHLGRPGIDMFSSRWQAYFAAGIRISLPVFHWHRGREEGRIVSAAVAQLENRRREYLRLVEHSLERLFTRQKILENQQKQAQRLVGYADEDARIKGDLYREQQLPNVDFLAAQADRERFRSRLEEIACELTLTRIAVQKIIGYREEEQ